MELTLSPKNQLLALGAWAISMLITLAVYVGGVADQLTFANNSICLLYVENYHLEDNNNNKVWLFDASSPSCSANVSAGSIGFFLLALLAGVRAWYLYKSEEPSRNVILVLAVVASVWTLVAFIMACIFSSGLSQTCSQFQKASKSCGAVFGEGFFESAHNGTYYKNINTINAALGASWVVFIGFGIYAVYEWMAWKNSSLKWW